MANISYRDKVGAAGTLSGRKTSVSNRAYSALSCQAWQNLPQKGTGLLSSRFPDALTTIEGLPVSAQVLVRYRANSPSDPLDGALVAQTTSSAYGEWQIDGLDSSLRYDVFARYAGENDALQASVTPFDEARFQPSTVLVTVGIPLDVPLPVIGGIGTVSTVYVSGAYPSGVTLVGDRLQSAWPTGATGTYPVTYELTDDVDTYTRVLTLDVQLLPLLLEPDTLPAMSMITTVSVTFAASGGEGPYTYSVSAGSLPPGLTLNSSTGVLSGTPSMGGTYSFTVTATDVRSTAASHSFSVAVSLAFATYAEFRAHAVGLSVDASYAPSTLSSLTMPSAGKTVRYVVGDARSAFSGGAWGSPAAGNQAVTSDSSMSRVIQHAIEALSSLPTAAAENVFIVTTSSATTAPSFSSVTKNGFSSMSYGSYAARAFTTFVYWDYGLGAARVYDATTNTYSGYAP